MATRRWDDKAADAAFLPPGCAGSVGGRGGCPGRPDSELPCRQHGDRPRTRANAAPIAPQRPVPWHRAGSGTRRYRDSAIDASGPRFQRHAPSSSRTSEPGSPYGIPVRDDAARPGGPAVRECPPTCEWHRATMRSVSCRKSEARREPTATTALHCGIPAD